MNTIESTQAANQTTNMPGQELWRIREREAGRLAALETIKRFSPITPKNIKAACKFHDETARKILHKLHA